MHASTFALGIAWYVIFLFSTVFHEAAHALTAALGGDDTATAQVTLDPLPHIRREPIGMVVIPWLVWLMSAAGGGGAMMMGWASTPFDPHWASRHPRRAAWMALAGPLANLLLALLGGFALRFLSVGVFNFHPSQTLLLLLEILFTLNVLLFVLNLMPVTPLDGATAITLLMPESVARSWQATMRNPMMSMVGLLVLWFFFPAVAGPILTMARRLIVGG